MASGVLLLVSDSKSSRMMMLGRVTPSRPETDPRMRCPVPLAKMRTLLVVESSSSRQRSPTRLPKIDLMRLFCDRFQPMMFRKAMLWLCASEMIMISSSLSLGLNNVWCRGKMIELFVLLACPRGAMIALRLMLWSRSISLIRLWNSGVSA